MNQRVKVKLTYTISAIIFSLSLLLGNLPFRVGATSSSAWFSSNSPTVTQLESGMASIPTNSDGQPCEYMSIKTKKRTVYSNSENWSSQCVRTMPYGFETLSSYLQIGDVAGPLQDINNRNTLIPIPNTNTILSLTSGQYGLSRLSFNYDFTQHLTTAVGGSILAPTGTISYQINTSPQDPISDIAGHQLNLNYNTMAFSSNGKYLVVDDPGIGLLRIDLQSHLVTPFGNSFYYFNGNYNAAGFLAISDDGKMVALSAPGQNRLEMYDMDTCGTVPATISGPVSCDMKNLWPTWSSAAPGTNAASNIRFADNDTLYAYTHLPSMGYTKYALTSYGHTITTQQYLALGDSFSAGEGAYSYELGTDTSNNKCHLSTKSYPYRIATLQNYTSFHSIACSGATSKDITGHAQYPTQPTPNSLGSWMPGLTSQVNKVLTSQPNIITIGIGGNDIGFRQKLTECVKPGTCFNSYDARVGLVDEIDNEYNKLVATYSSVKDTAKSTSKIYAIGYPHIADSSGSCADNVHLNSEEISLSNTLIDHLNYAIQQAALSSGIAYVNVSDAFNGRRLCDGSANNLAMNGLTYGQEILHVIGAESFHPNSLGQKYLQSAISSATSNFTIYAPGATSSAVQPSRSSATAQALLGPYTTPDNNPINVPIVDSQIPDTGYKSSGLSFTVNQNDSTFKPNTPYTVTLHSTPIVLGTFTTDSQGNLAVTAAIPSSVDNGLHTLDITGTNVAEQPVDVYQSIAVGNTPNDFDGDGNVDSTHSCVLTAPSNHDVDQDGVDDACDDTIGRAPSDISQLYRARQGNPANGESANDIYLERNVALASSMLGITDYDADGDGWSLIGITAASQAASLANIKVNDIGLTENTYDEYVPVISARSQDNGCITLTSASLAAITSSSSTLLTTTSINSDTCRIEAPDSDVDNNSIPDNTQTLYRLRNGSPALGESSSDVFIERNIAAGEAALGLSDYDDDSDGWAKIAQFNSTYTYTKIGLLDTSTSTIIADGSAAFTLGLLSQYTQQQRRAIVPVIAMTDGDSCHDYVPDNLDFVASGQARTVDLLSTNPLSCTN